MIELKKQSAAISVEAKDTDINFNKPTLKGDKGEDGFSPTVDYAKASFGHILTIQDKNKKTVITIKDGERGAKGDKGNNGLDGYSPIVTLTPEEEGTTITVTDAQGTKEAFISNGKDAEGGAGGIVIKSMYVANDYADGIVASGYSPFDFDFTTYKELPEKAKIVDIGIWYTEDDAVEAKEYKGYELYENELLSAGNAYLNIFATATNNSSWGGMTVAKGYDEETGKLLTSVSNYLDYVKGFTIYYFEYIEGDTNENA